MTPFLVIVTFFQCKTGNDGRTKISNFLKGFCMDEWNALIKNIKHRAFKQNLIKRFLGHIDFLIVYHVKSL